jgi:hypothetical protein
MVRYEGGIIVLSWNQAAGKLMLLCSAFLVVTMVDQR